MKRLVCSLFGRIDRRRAPSVQAVAPSALAGPAALDLPLLALFPCWPCCPCCCTDASTRALAGITMNAANASPTILPVMLFIEIFPFATWYFREAHTVRRMRLSFVTTFRSFKNAHSDGLPFGQVHKPSANRSVRQRALTLERPKPPRRRGIPRGHDPGRSPYRGCGQGRHATKPGSRDRQPSPPLYPGSTSAVKSSSAF